MKFNDFFKHVSVINLPDRHDRRREMGAQLKRVAIQAEFYAAVRPTEAGDWPGIGARGCFQSQFGVLQKAFASRVDRVLVLEDDLDFSPAFNQEVNETLRQISSADWDILYLGHLETGRGTDRLELLASSRPVMTAYFYAVQGRVLPRLVAFLSTVESREAGHPLGGPQHFDGALCMFRQQNPDVRTMIVHPALGSQRRSRSDISAAWYDRLPIAGAAINAARRFRRVVLSLRGA